MQSPPPPVKEMMFLDSASGENIMETNSLTLNSSPSFKVFFLFWFLVSKITIAGFSPLRPTA